MVLTAALSLIASPLAAQQVVELPAEDRLLDADFEEVYRVGAVAGEDWETFGNVRDLAFDRAGNLYVVDIQGARIVVVNPEGGFLRQLGGVGQGPGEFDQHNTTSIRIAVLSDGRTVAFDQRFSLFGPDGEFERTVRLRDGAMIFMPRLDVDRRGEGVLATGEVRIIDCAMLRGRADGTPTQPEYRHVMRMNLTDNEASLDTVAHAWLPPGEATGFIPPLIAGALPRGGVAYTDSSAYAIKVMGADGRLERVLTRPFVPEPVTDRIRQEERERRLRGLEGDPLGAGRAGGRRGAVMSGMTDAMRAQAQSMEFYPVVPVVRGLRTSWEGRIWVPAPRGRAGERWPRRCAHPGRTLPGHLLGGRDVDAGCLRSRRAGRVRGSGRAGCADGGREASAGSDTLIRRRGAKC
jgi:hypothetical protein